MPYASTQELPAEVKRKYGPKQQRAFRQAFNSAMSDGASEDKAFQIAHAAARRITEKSAEQLAREAVERARTFTQDERRKLARRGAAMSDGSFPIANAQDLRNAIQALGRAKSPDAAKAHIRKRARALGLTNLLPDSWKEKSAQGPSTPVQRVRAFLVESAGKTILTAPASSARPDVQERAWTPNPHFLYLQGKFVGAEQANRNGALWTTADLEMGEPTVRHGPLNWLHEDRHIIGALVDAKMERPFVEGAAEGLAPSESPFIRAAAVMWRYLWPQEAQVIEQAADQSRLWYSMECVSREVACVDHGCGSYPYMDTVRQQANVCEHIRERSGRRRLVDPVFLGGAVIVPPVRPGWPEGHAELLQRASAHAERAYEQAGQPDVSASEWEALMAQVLDFAERAAA